MFLFCRKALRNVELLKDMDWPLFQIMYFAKIVGFALERKLFVVCRTSLKSIRLLKKVHWALTVMFGLHLWRYGDGDERNIWQESHHYLPLDVDGPVGS